MRLNILFSLFILLIISTSCEKHFLIGGHFVNSLNEKPIAGLEVGLFKGKIDSDVTLKDFELIDTSVTDSSGNFTFKIDENDNIQLHYYIPIPTTDTNSVNSKYIMTFFNNSHPADWSKNKRWTLIPSTETVFVFRESEIMRNVILTYENQMSYGHWKDDKIFYTLSLTPGESHCISTYDITNNKLQHIKDLDIYVKSHINTEDRIQYIAPMKVEIEIDNF